MANFSPSDAFYAIVGTSKPYQSTLCSAVTCSGIGVHSGTSVQLTLKPASQNQGIVFVRTDLDSSCNTIQAIYSNVTDTRMCTTLTNSHGVSISTVEHVVAALAGASITNAVIEVSGPEVPIMDGSSVIFSQMIQDADVSRQPSSVPFIDFLKPIRILKPVRVSEGKAWAEYTPASRRLISIEFDAHGRLSPQLLTFQWDQEDFADLISNARTFGFYEDAEKLWAAGLAKGASLDNTIVIHNHKVMNEEGLRSDDELVRHKILDAVGDLGLAGCPIYGQFKGYNSGHGLNNKLLRALFADPDCFEICHFSTKK